MKRFLIPAVLASVFALAPSVASAGSRSSFSFGLNLGGLGFGYHNAWGGHRGGFSSVSFGFSAPIYRSYNYCGPSYSSYCAPSYSYAPAAYYAAPAYSYAPAYCAPAPTYYAQPAYAAPVYCAPVYRAPVATYYYSAPVYNSGYYYRR